MKLFQSAVTLFVVFFLGLGIVNAATVPAAGREKVTQLLRRSLPDVPSHKGVLVTVSFLPGQAAKPHKHPGSVFAYVLQGSIISQLEGQKPVTYHQGQFWYEPPNVGHILCKNASSVKPAKLVVWQLINDNAPLLIPYSKK